MTMRPGLRKAALLAHVTSSVGWAGAVTCFLVLTLVTLNSPNADLVRAGLSACGLLTQFVIVPFALASVFTGLVQSLGTSWGLFRHYWVIAKLLLTLAATAALLLHTEPISYLARISATNAPHTSHVDRVHLQMVIDSGAGLAVLLLIAGLAIYKPRGLTRYGWRKQQQRAQGRIHP
ncbi:hypothetical protein EV385_5094 [Krasilnikovia cinnamomea]|uniref:DUF2269 domain-containing protein n=1 Tax=Krasilnikovia cinnamomea TaxID=349313 RepID=A0A4Q7ZQ32_9ACTN|nr:DUF2269 domain-containing protein [Krasilnikovia cinnamomea]RZU53200.1 hypothetical protein EV385_5094 [Krasilnikovia cinnamomea]